ncbi:MAG: hypothetical protein AABZ28_05665 [Nitrospinota bacterium]|jgi:hypothetical protein
MFFNNPDYPVHPVLKVFIHFKKYEHRRMDFPINGMGRDNIPEHILL